jgi:hypothetical protein
MWAALWAARPSCGRTATLYSEAWQAAAFVWASAARQRRGARRRAHPESRRRLAAPAIGGLTNDQPVFAPEFLVAAIGDRSQPIAVRLKTATVWRSASVWRAPSTSGGMCISSAHRSTSATTGRNHSQAAAASVPALRVPRG